jgi:hypothetical protein
MAHSLPERPSGCDHNSSHLTAFSIFVHTPHSSESFLLPTHPSWDYPQAITAQHVSESIETKTSPEGPPLKPSPKLNKKTLSSLFRQLRQHVGVRRCVGGDMEGRDGERLRGEPES